MGSSNNKPLPPPPVQPDPMDVMLDMKMSAKRFERESNKAEKEQKKQIEKARLALKKNNEEGAKLYLQNAAMKKNESLSYLRMAHKLDVIQSNMKSNLNNQQMMQTMNKLTPYLQHHSTTLPIEQIYSQMQNFETAMDDIQVQNKIINQAVNSNTDASSDMMVDQMLQQMKNEELNQIDGQLNQSLQQQYNGLQTNQNQQQQYQQQQQFQQQNQFNQQQYQQQH